MRYQFWMQKSLRIRKQSAYMHPPCLASRSWTLRCRQTRRASMNKCCAIATLVDLLEIDDQFARIMLGVCEDLCTEQGDNMV